MSRDAKTRGVIRGGDMTWHVAGNRCCGCAGVGNGVPEPSRFGSFAI
jgi:hypothetical protein